MHLFELIDQAKEWEDLFGPMMKVFILSEEEGHLIQVFNLDSSWDEEGNPIIVIE